MSIGSGLAHSLGFAAETTYGTYTAPTVWIENNDANLKKVKNVVQGDGLAAGRMVQLGSRRVVTTKAGGGTFNLDMPSKRMGHIFNGLLGGSVTPVQQGATIAYLQTHPLADPFGKKYTFQAGVPDLAGTVRPYTFLGCKILAMEVSCGIDEPLRVAVEVDARDVSEAQSLAAPSYPSGVNIFHFAQSAVKLGTVGAEAQVDGIRRMSCRIARGSRVDRFYHGNAGLKSEPIINAFTEISGVVEADYLDKTVYADRFAADSSTSLVWELIGPNIASTFFETFRIKVPQIFFNGDTPVVSGPDVVSGSFPFVGRYDATNAAVTIEYMSTDVTLGG